MQDLGYDENDDDSDDDFGDYQARARQSLIESTKNNVEKHLEVAQLAKHDVFIVSSSVIFSLVTAKRLKKTAPEIDEAFLMETILRMAYARRYGNQPLGIEYHSNIVTGNLLTNHDNDTNSRSLALTWLGYDSK